MSQINQSINKSINQSSIRLLQKNIPSDTDAGGIYNKSEANIRVKLLDRKAYVQLQSIFIYW